MIAAELHGKTDGDASNISVRSEDLLTSTAFGLLRYLTPQVGLIPLLRKVRPVSMRGGTCGINVPDETWIDLAEAVHAEVEFWPSFGPYGQPDILIRLRDASQRLTGLVVIEVKLYSPKSGFAGEDDEELAVDDVPDPDQLVKYWQGLARVSGAAEVQRSLIYLTAHRCAPRTELKEGLQRLPLMRLGWLNWFDVADVASEVATADPGNLVAHDLSMLLEHRGFTSFKGFSVLPFEVPRISSFWVGNRTTRQRWFNLPTIEFPSSIAFWRNG
jgi:hypothetical protein